MKRLLVVYGEGGHASEASNFMSEMRRYSDVKIYTCSSLPNSDFIFSEMREKYNNFSLLKGFIENIKKINELIGFYKSLGITHVVSLGPGISVVPIFVAKSLSIKTAHIETSCRFESKSLTGKVLYPIVDTFYVQNEELLSIYKKGIWIGRL
ncbi:PssD/Cps14F family polysaccharide biosynthesis glycosyltransferase [Vibrio antiquarius]|uniref:PssD/Cps14F family polysaccharide biosynthesis glycosyltransferase n=1 Tax=Vibrio antiquarius (strain Ex25) TaxID=150340 RepID=UPI002658C072|nr:PssD/Cps14F family polysaccharide biosynthesis glycosyltransferase [Vibrio antiquarius]MCR9580132.1 UDP-N-acetylglucosamine transferase subunit ALG14 [Vibrio antiquarius]MCR9619815.1 UDP-N-acetylglucosamine transferase subunit ALG14 [Vibrio antiquarius]